MKQTTKLTSKTLKNENSKTREQTDSDDDAQSARALSEVRPSGEYANNRTIFVGVGGGGGGIVCVCVCGGVGGRRGVCLQNFSDCGDQSSFHIVF